MRSERRYRYRLYPTKGQQRMLARTFGCVRVVHNDAIALRHDAWQQDGVKVGYGELDRRCITDAKKTSERAWLSEVSTVALQQAVRHAHRAYINWWQHQARPPRMKRKHGRQSFTLTQRGFRVRGRGDGCDRARVHLAKIGWVSVRWSRPLPSDPTSVTITREADGRFYASFVCTVESVDAGRASTAGCGVDVGLTHLATITTTGGDTVKVDNPRYLQKAQRKLAREQRALSRKQGARQGETPSSNYRKQRQKVAVLHRRVRDLRADHLRKLARRLVHENQVVAVEQLNVRGLGRSRLAKGVSDAAWSTLIRYLTEAADLHPDRQVVKVDARGTSRRCSACHHNSGPKPLSVRTWTCDGCGAVHDRDTNAARNILVAAGLAETINACGPDVRPSSLPSDVKADGDEAGTHRTARDRHKAAGA